MSSDGSGANEFASALVSAAGRSGAATAMAGGGESATAPGAANATATVVGAATGLAKATSEASDGDVMQPPTTTETVTTTASSPVLGATASAVTSASVGSGPLPSVAEAPGQTVALAELHPGSAEFASVDFGRLRRRGRVRDLHGGSRLPDRDRSA